MLFLLEFAVVLFGRLVRLYYTRVNFSLVPRAFQATLLYFIILCETALSLQMKISFFISDKSCHGHTL